MITLILLVLFLAFIFLGLKSSIREKKKEENANVNSPEGSIKKIFGKHWKIIQSQAMHETGNFKSNIFLFNNNLFGMKQPKVRETTSIGESLGYASYKSSLESVKDLYLWLNYNNINLDDLPNDDEEAIKEYSFLIRKKGYYEDSYSNYTLGMLNHLKTI